MTLPDRYLAAAAVDYAAAGLPVFLLGRTKRPVANCAGCPKGAAGHDPEQCACLTCHGFYAATCDPARIEAMFDAVLDGLLAMRTGAASGLLVLDIDPRHGGRVDWALMTPTATVATGGGGWHLYYRHPGGPVGAKLAGHPGVDIKADGGYVVAPPSIHPDTRRPYRWVSERPIHEMAPALAAACRAAAPLPGPPATGEASRAGGTRRAGPGGGAISKPEALLAAHLAAVASAPVGRRRRTLYGAARGVARMVAADAITRTDAVAALTDAGRAADQRPREIREAIAGGFRDEGVPL